MGSIWNDMRLQDCLKTLAAGNSLLMEVDDHHQPFNFVVTTPDELRDALMEVIAVRSDYYDFVEDAAGEPEPPISEAAAAGMPYGLIREAAEMEWRNYHARREGKDKLKREGELFAKARATGDLSAAWRFLGLRGRHEDEGFRLSEVRKPDAWTPAKQSA